jgi:hypothetical protein
MEIAAHLQASDVATCEQSIEADPTISATK